MRDQEETVTAIENPSLEEQFLFQVFKPSRPE